MIRAKIDRLKALFKNGDRVLLAYSGGVDSSLLLHLLARETVAGVCAVTIKTPYIPEWEVDEARAMCRTLGVDHTVIDLPLPEIIKSNPADRCYQCKKILFSRIQEYADEKGCNIIADGSNADDRGDYRPGMRALREMNILSPLLEAGFTKEEIRSHLQGLGLEIWDKPAYACLLTRLPHDTIINENSLSIIEKSERYIHTMGFPGTRVRLYNDMVRIECMPVHIDKISEPMVRASIVSFFNSVGIKFVSLDLEGYRSGSMNKKV